jgi:Na+-translocating ferredoxin:NAD+ oxidoreductase RnfC subunit
MLAQIKEAGIVGCGGAGFPTCAKLDCQAEYMIVNGAECEPLLQTDQYITRRFSAELVEAAMACARQVRAKHLVFALKDHYEAEIQAVETAVRALKSNARILRLKNYYPAGDEQMIVYEATGRIVPPGGIPLLVGAVVSNAATMLAVYDALRGGALTRKYITVAGDAARPCIVRAPVGVPLSECLQAAGSPLSDSALYVAGGPMMGRVLRGAELESEVVTKTTSGIIILPDQPVIARALLDPVKVLNRMRSACIQCRYCTDMCPRYLLGPPLEPHKIMRKMALNARVDE